MIHLGSKADFSMVLLQGEDGAAVFTPGEYYLDLQPFPQNYISGLDHKIYFTINDSGLLLNVKPIHSISLQSGVLSLHTQPTRIVTNGYSGTWYLPYNYPKGTHPFIGDTTLFLVSGIPYFIDNGSFIRELRNTKKQPTFSGFFIERNDNYLVPYSGHKDYMLRKIQFKTVNIMACPCHFNSAESLYIEGFKDTIRSWTNLTFIAGLLYKMEITNSQGLKEYTLFVPPKKGVLKRKHFLK